MGARTIASRRVVRHDTDGRTAKFVVSERIWPRSRSVRTAGGRGARLGGPRAGDRPAYRGRPWARADIGSHDVRERAYRPAVGIREVDGAAKTAHSGDDCRARRFRTMGRRQWRPVRDTSAAKAA